MNAIVATSASATAQPAVERSPPAGSQSLRKAQLWVEQIDSATPVAAKTPSALNNTLSNWAAMMVIATAVIAKEDDNHYRVTGKRMTREELLSIYAQVASQLITGPQTITAMAAGGMVASAANPLVRGISGAPGKTISMATARSLMAHTLSSTLFMGTASAANNLWDKAVEQLATDDREKARNLIDAILTSMKNPGFKGKALAFADQGRVLGQIAVNMGKIAANSRDRNLWLYDTWRNSIATGSFVTSAGAMAAGSVAGAIVGEALFPAGGGIVGSMIGNVAGAAGATFIPEKYNNFLSEKFVALRQGANEKQLQSCMTAMSNTFRKAEAAGANTNQHVDRAKLLASLTACEKIRENYVTILMDQLRQSWQANVQAKRDADTAQRSNRPGAVVQEFKDQASKAELRMNKARGDMMDFYSVQIAALQKLAHTLTGPLASGIMNDQIRRLTTISARLKEVLDGIPDDRQSLVLMAMASLDGFNEGYWEQTTQETEDLNAPSARNQAGKQHATASVPTVVTSAMPAATTSR